MPAKKVRLSVRRNRCKRLLREAYKATESRLKGPYSLVFTVQRDISGKKLAEVVKEIKGLYSRGGIQR